MNLNSGGGEGNHGVPGVPGVLTDPPDFLGLPLGPKNPHFPALRLDQKM